MLIVLTKFLDLQAAERALRAGRTDEASAALERAAEACERAKRERIEGQLAYEQSDDLRLYIALVEARSVQLRARMRANSTS